MRAWLWGLHKGWWHALARHDPEYHFTEVESAKLTAIARAKDPKAKPVVVRVPDPTVKEGPGHGTTICGLRHIPLDRIGVEPEVSTDPLCEACRLRGSD